MKKLLIILAAAPTVLLAAAPAGAATTTPTTSIRFTISPRNSGWHVLRVVSPAHRRVARRSVSRSVRVLVRQQQSANCTPGYSPCIPVGPDVDCAGGSGNGPRYVKGPVYVTGSDPYGLDSDGDGIGCES